MPSIGGSFNSAVANRGSAVNTAISFVVDRSGSMYDYIERVKEAVAQFISDQAQTKGIASLTMSQFDSQFEVIFANKDIKEVDPELFNRQYYARGSTRLYDAVLTAIANMEDSLKSLPAADKPKRILMPIVTDGEDDSGYHSDSANKVKEAIQRKQNEGWEFVLLGAGSEIDRTIEALGIKKENAAFFLPDNVGKSIEVINRIAKDIRKGKKDVGITGPERATLQLSSKAFNQEKKEL